MLQKFKDTIKKLLALEDDDGNRTRHTLMRISLAFVLAGLALFLNFHRIEAFFYDARILAKGSEETDPRIELISIGETANQAIGDLGLDQMAAHVHVLKFLLEQKPLAIAYLNRFSHSSDLLRENYAKQFVQLAQKAEKTTGVKVFFGTDVDITGEVIPPYPLSLLPHYPAVLHKDGTMFSKDNVLRRALLTVPEKLSIHMKLGYLGVSDAELIKKIKDVRGAYFHEPSGAWHSMIRFPGNTSLQKDTFPRKSLTTLLLNRDNIPQNYYKGKIILIGDIYREELYSFNYTPYSQKNYTNPKLYSHASILDSLLKNNGILIATPWYDVIITFSLALLLVYFSLRFTPAQGIVLLLLTSVIFCSFAALIFTLSGIWINMVHPLFATFCSYYLFIPYRAVMEHKKRSDVQKKHDLAVQLEEMKRNFLSLMSHDLKTPVARIQGLSEFIMKQGPLSEQQKKGAQQIIESADSLDKFITKILDLTRVESSAIQPDMKAKDINEVIKKSVQELSFQAKQRNIKITVKTDPLFPISIDAALIVQVLVNLIDNAIQYSPEGSKIELESEETENFIKIRIKDYGKGFTSKEKKMIFTKFYRGENPAGKRVKGSGLGLYLSKYFIELHKGKIDLDSQEGIGSVFTVSLPVDKEMIT